MTTEDKFKSAIKDIRKQGVKWHTNVQQCCRGCITNEQLGLTEDDNETPYGFTYGGQGNAIKWHNGEAVNRTRFNQWEKFSGTFQKIPERIKEDSIYINFGGNEAGNIIARIFKFHGFDVDWNGSEYSCVVLKLTSDNN